MASFSPEDLLDVEYYSRTYGIHQERAKEHYFSQTNGRITNPNPLFNTEWYLRQRPDVAESRFNPLLHFLAHGCVEGTSPHPLLDLDWFNRQLDNKSANYLDLMMHHLRWGPSHYINSHPLFDAKWYIGCHPDVASFGRSPLIHYIEYGAGEGWDPHPLFDTEYYLEQRPDVVDAQSNPLMHYVWFGFREGYSPQRLFDVEWYAGGKLGLRALKEDPISHYLRRGAAEGRDPHPAFATAWYSNNRQDVVAAGLNPLVHYIRFGAREGCNPHPLFDADWYLRNRPEVVRLGVNPLTHYLQYGAAERSSPHPLFDANWYASHHLDPVGDTNNPLVHFLVEGANKLFDPHPWFSTQFYLEQRAGTGPIGNAAIDFVTRRRDDFVEPHPLFDAEWYLAAYTDIKTDKLGAYIHWVAHGLSEQRQSTPLIDQGYYYSHYPDVAAAGLSAAYHYMAGGHAENRNPCALFDTAWYRAKYMADLPHGENPLLHFAKFSATREYDPGPRFSTSAYCDKHPDLRRTHRIALVHFLKWGRASGAEMFLSDPDNRMSARYQYSNEISAAAMIGLRESDLSSIQNHFLYQPINVDIDPKLSSSPRVQIFLPGLNRRYATGGPNTVYILGCLIANAGLPVTFVSLDVPPDADIEPLKEHLQSITKINISSLDLQFVDASNRDKPYRIGYNDIFIATAWWTAQAVKSAAALTANPKFFYLIQDLESTFYGGSVLQSVARETYTFDHYPIINTSFLFDQLKNDGIGRYADPKFANDAIVFEPAVDRTFFYPGTKDGSGSRKLLFYTRPTMAERNLFGLGVAALRAVASDGLFDGAPWEIIGMGEGFTPVPLGHGHTLKPAPWMDFAGYAELMRSADVLVSLMFSPHPSYPPLEMAVCGNPVVTTTYGVKTTERMAGLSRSIIAVEPTLTDIAFGITRALARRDRQRNDVDIDPKLLPHSWVESLSAVLPRILRLMAASGITPDSARGALRPIMQSSSRHLPPAVDLEIYRRRNSLRSSSAKPSIAFVVGATAQQATIASRDVIRQIAPLNDRSFGEGTVSMSDRSLIFKDLNDNFMLFGPCTPGDSAERIMSLLVEQNVDYVVYLDPEQELLPDALRVLRASFEQLGDFDAALFRSAHRGEGSESSVPAVNASLARRLLADYSASDAQSLSHFISAALNKRGIKTFEVPYGLTLPTR